jgi:GNAT superfamily N-acetyltransferase
VGLKMGEFYITLSQQEIAKQIADLINKYNKLYTYHTDYSIVNSAADYFVEIVENKVVGCTGLLKEFPAMSKSYHTSVLPEYRRRGLGAKLLLTAMNNCQTPYIYGTIREDNTASLELVGKLGWKFIRKDWNRDHYIITVAVKLVQGENYVGA